MLRCVARFLLGWRLAFVVFALTSCVGGQSLTGSLTLKDDRTFRVSDIAFKYTDQLTSWPSSLTTRDACEDMLIETNPNTWVDVVFQKVQQLSLTPAKPAGPPGPQVEVSLTDGKSVTGRLGYNWRPGTDFKIVAKKTVLGSTGDWSIEISKVSSITRGNVYVVREHSGTNHSVSQPCFAVHHEVSVFSGPSVERSYDSLPFLVGDTRVALPLKNVASLVRLDKTRDQFQITMWNGDSSAGTYTGMGGVLGQIDNNTFIYGYISDFKKIVFDLPKTP